jgi:hypothetical protein
VHPGPNAAERKRSKAAFFENIYIRKSVGVLSSGLIEPARVDQELDFLRADVEQRWHHQPVTLPLPIAPPAIVTTTLW